MKNLRRMQFLKRFFVDVRQVDTRSKPNAVVAAAAHHRQDSATNSGNADLSDSQADAIPSALPLL